MKLGNKILIILILFLNIKFFLIADEKITSSPLINIDKIKPSFEEFEENNEKVSLNQNLKKKRQLRN